MDSKEKLAGWGLAIHAAISLAAVSIAFVVFYLFFHSGLPDFMVWVFVGFMGALILINSIGLAAGIGLIQDSSGPHSLAIPYSVYCLINFPFGTMVGFFYLWVYFEGRN